MLPYPDPPLAGAGFVLRPFRAADASAARALEQDEAAARWVPPLPASDGEGAVAFYEACRETDELLHLVIAASDDEYLGEVMVALGEQGVGELGCALLPQARGRGIAAAALGVLTEWALDVGGLALGRAQVFVATENRAALRLAERAGYRREGVLRAYWDGEDGRTDVIVLSRLPRDAG